MLFYRPVPWEISLVVTWPRWSIPLGKRIRASTRTILPFRVVRATREERQDPTDAINIQVPTTLSAALYLTDGNQSCSRDGWTTWTRPARWICQPSGMDVTATIWCSGQERRNVRRPRHVQMRTTLVDTAVAIAAAENWVTNCKTQNERPQLPLWQPLIQVPRIRHGGDW
jgi:hypothetical protein